MNDAESRAPVEAWLSYAADDLQAAHTTEGVVARLRCFHAQQAAEKAIKGLLTSLKIEFPKQHDLNLLNGLLPWRVAASASDLEWLTKWAMHLRYPGDWPSASQKDAERAALLASAVLDEVRARVDGPTDES